MKKDTYKSIGTLWMPVKDHEAEYDIDMETGAIKAHYNTTYVCKKYGKLVTVHRSSKKTLKGTVTSRGYVQVVLAKGKRKEDRFGKFRYVHDLVAELVWEKPAEQEYYTKHARKVQVYHLDGDKENNAWWNLAWRVVLGDGEGTWYPPRKMTKEFKKIYDEALAERGEEWTLA